MTSRTRFLMTALILAIGGSTQSGCFWLTAQGPNIGPFYPYPQVPLGWRRVSLEWDDGWWWLDFDERHMHSHHH